MVPLIELRGAIPAGYALGMPMILNYLICCIGNLLPIPVILIFVKFVLDWMRRSNVAFFNKVSGFIYEKAEKNKPKITKYATWGLFYICCHSAARYGRMDGRTCCRAA